LFKSWLILCIVCFVYGLFLGSIIVLENATSHPIVWLFVSVPFATAVTLARAYYEQLNKLKTSS
jgi:O-antigen/teichoic acid export membrane protein